MPVFPLVWTGGFQPILPEDLLAQHGRRLTILKGSRMETMLVSGVLAGIRESA